MAGGRYGDARRRFQLDTQDHRMQVLHDHGLYRHLRFRDPTRSFYWFEIITWPGRLAIHGDFGESYVFSRDADMLKFFGAHRCVDPVINPDYWSEKLAGGRRSVMDYDSEYAAKRIEEAIAEYERHEYRDLLLDTREAWNEWLELPDAVRRRIPHKKPRVPRSPNQIRRYVQRADRYGDALSHQAQAYEFLAELEKVAPEAFGGTWEWNLQDWRWTFLWACHAIAWGVRQYDALTRMDRTKIRAARLLHRPAPTFRHDIPWSTAS